MSCPQITFHLAFLLNSIKLFIKSVNNIVSADCLTRRLSGGAHGDERHVTTSKDILERGYTRLVKEYERLGIKPGRVIKFVLKPTWNAVIGTNGCCGVAISFRGNHAIYEEDQTRFKLDELKTYVGASLFDVARDHMSSGVIRRSSIALAALNALSQPLLDEGRLERLGHGSVKSFSDVVMEDDVVVIIGYGGLVKDYLGRCRELHVTDMRPAESLKTVVVGDVVEYGPMEATVHSAKDNEVVLSQADVALITGSTLVNGTFNEVVGYASKARIRCLYGPSAQLLPDILFESGINAVMSVAISDPARFEYDMVNELDIEPALKRHQRKYVAWAPELTVADAALSCEKTGPTDDGKILRIL